MPEWILYNHKLPEGRASVLIRVRAHLGSAMDCGRGGARGDASARVWAFGIARAIEMQRKQYDKSPVKGIFGKGDLGSASSGTEESNEIVILFPRSRCRWACRRTGLGLIASWNRP